MTERKSWIMTAGDIAGSISAAVYNLLHSHTERVRLRKVLERELLIILLTVLGTVVALRRMDVQGIDQSGRVAVREEMPVEELAALRTAYAGELVDKAAAVEIEPTESEINAVARVLFGMRKNSERDLRAVVWLICNRVESGLYPDTIEEVCDQAGQWICYSQFNDLSPALVEIAREELKNWKNGRGRLIPESDLWMDWSPETIRFKEVF